jgi:membrane protease YdiL (CAAX protease family)
LKKINDFFLNTNQYILIGIFVSFNIFISFLFSIISKLIFGNSFTSNIHKFENLTEEFILVVIVSPIIETIIFQFIIIEIFYEKCNKYLICGLSAILFASSHLYNILYFVFAFIMGLAFAYLYILGKKKEKGIKYVFLSHLIYNLIAFILNHL